MCHRYPAGTQRAVTKPSAADLGWVQRKFEVKTVVSCFSQTSCKQRQGSTLRSLCVNFVSVLFTNNGSRGELFSRMRTRSEVPCMSPVSLLACTAAAFPGVTSWVFNWEKSQLNGDVGTGCFTPEKEFGVISPQSLIWPQN